MAVPENERNVVILVNDYQDKYRRAIEKLSKRLGRELKIVLLVDEKLKETGKYSHDETAPYDELVCNYDDDVSLHSAVASFSGGVILALGVSELNQDYLQKLLPHVPYINNPTTASLDWATHKGQMRAIMEAYNPEMVPKVHEVEVWDPAHINEITSRLSFPMIIKPTGLAQSVLVSKANNRDELHEMLEHSFTMLESAYRQDRGRGAPSMIVEEFIEGDMYTVDGYVNHLGEVWTLPFLKTVTNNAAGLEGFHNLHTDSFLDLSEADLAAGDTMAQSSARALALKSTAVHIELFHTKNGWKIIELGARTGGLRDEIYAEAFGIDHIYNELLIKLNLDPEITTDTKSFVSMIDISPQEDGVLHEIRGVDEARRLPHVCYANVMLEPGPSVSVSVEGSRVLVLGMISAPTREEAEAARDEAIRLIQPVIKPIDVVGGAQLN
jgi:hypothetical protein